MKRLWIVLVVLLCASPAFAQKSVVETVKASLVARGVNLIGPCGAFEITKRVAWQLRALGAGLVVKPGGNNCQGYSTDIVQFAPPSGQWVDMLKCGGDPLESGCSNEPAWNEQGIGNPAVWHPAIDPGDSPNPPPIPNPPPAPPPSIDWSAAVYSRIEWSDANNERRYLDLKAEAAAAAARDTALAAKVQAVYDKPGFVGELLDALKDRATIAAIITLISTWQVVDRTKH